MPKIPPPPFGAVFKGATSQILEQFMDLSGPSYKPTVFNPSSQVMKGPLRGSSEQILGRTGEKSKRGGHVNDSGVSTLFGSAYACGQARCDSCCMMVSKLRCMPDVLL